MAWFALDDGFDTHPKVRKAGNAAVGLFVRLGVHATRHLTEGHLDGDIVRQYGTEPNVRKLIAVGMLHGAGHTCPRCVQPAEGDYVIHDYLDYNKSRAQIEAAREAARKRQNRGRENARRNRNEHGKDPLFEGSVAGQGDLSRRDTHEGATGVPSPPLPSPNYDVADVDEGTTASRPIDLDASAPSPIDVDGFELTDAMRRWAKRDGYADLVDIDHATAQFISHYRSTGARRSSWPDAWQKWIRDDAKRASERAHRGPSNVIQLPSGQTLTGTDAKVAGWAAVAAQLAEQGDSA
jgi:hypothetical protein